MRLLHLDVETRPTTALTWGLFDQNISLDQIVEPGRIICWAAMWHGEKRVYFADERAGAKPMFEAIHALLDAADCVCTYNGDRFDLPKLTGSFIEHGLSPPAPSASIDLYKTVKRMGLDSAKLAFVAPFLQIGAKVKHEGFPLWRKCMEGDEAAWKRMKRYNEMDVRLLSRLYERLRPWIKTHPYLGKPVKAKTPGAECPRCQSTRTQSRGIRRTRVFIIQRIQCLGCGGWFDGTRSKA